MYQYFFYVWKIDKKQSADAENPAVYMTQQGRDEKSVILLFIDSLRQFERDQFAIVVFYCQQFC